MRNPQLFRLAFWIPALALVVGLRIVDLGSDPYSALDWDTGIMTDEGFYTHNARNLALFGRARMDDFNNMLVSPLLHYFQTAVFRVFGFSSVNARGISVFFSLLTLPVFFAGLRRVYGLRIAATAVILLGLDHFSVLFDRMALNDIPAAFLAVCAFYAFVRATELAGTSRGFWAATLGALVGLTFVSRSLCIYLIPTAAIALWFAGDSVRNLGKRMLPMACGFGCVLALYVVVWYLPNRAEIDHMYSYYQTVQTQPDSVERLVKNIRIAFLGERFGVFPNLFRHTPVVFGLCFIIAVACTLGVRGAVRERAANAFMVLWLLIAGAMFAVSSYAPNRYSVTLLPAVYGLAAVAFWRLPELAGILFSGGIRATAARFGVTWLLAYHAFQAVTHGVGWGIYVTATLPAFCCAMIRVDSAKRRFLEGWRPAAALIGLWAGINAGWMANWWLHREYTLRESSQWLAQNLPAGTVLLGDVAPGLAMDTRFQTVNVMKGFANDARPVEEFGGGPAYVLTIDGTWKTPYWAERYPEIVDPARRIRRWRVMKWTIGLYAVSGGWRAQRDNTSYTSASALEASGTVRRSGLAESVYAAGRARAGSSF